MVFTATGYALTRSGWPGDIDSAFGVARRFYGDNIILEFGYGVLVERALFARASAPWPRWIYAGVMALGFVGLACTHDIPPRALTEGLAAAVIVWAGVRVCADVRAPMLELLGAASYSIYLFHWASFGAVKPLVTSLQGMADGWPKVTLLMIAHIATAIAAGLTIHIAIERPFMRWATRRWLGRSEKAPAALSA